MNAEVWEAAGLQCNGTFPLEQFSYDNSALLDVIFRHVKETNFSGITVSGGGDAESWGGGGISSCVSASCMLVVLVSYIGCIHRAFT